MYQDQNYENRRRRPSGPDRFYSRDDEARYRSTARGNNGVLENSRGFNYAYQDSDIYENEFGSGNQPRYRRDNMYRSEYPDIDHSTAHSYSNYRRNHHREDEPYNERDRNFFQRAGDRIRETWNDWIGNDEKERYRNEYENEDPYRRQSGRNYSDDSRGYSQSYRNYNDYPSERRYSGGAYGDHVENDNDRWDHYPYGRQKYYGREGDYARRERRNYSRDNAQILW